MSTFDLAEFDHYNEGVHRAVDARDAEAALALGKCTVCHIRNRDGNSRRCRTCFKAGRQEGVR